MTDVYVLVATAVYDQGVYGVFTTEQEAVDHAEALLDESDYHHTFRVDRRTIGVAVPVDEKLTGSFKDSNPELYETVRAKYGRPTMLRGNCGHAYPK